MDIVQERYRRLFGYKEEELQYKEYDVKYKTWWKDEPEQSIIMACCEQHLKDLITGKLISFKLIKTLTYGNNSNNSKDTIGESE